MSINFCHISPTAHLNLVSNRETHLVLSHIIEKDSKYVDFYLEQKERNPNTKIIMDNGAFEMYKAGLPMYSPDKLVEMATKINADYIVMTDYPGEHGEKTIESAKSLAPKFHESGFKTFFVPQSRVGDIDDCINTFRWASLNTDLVDYVGVSILTAPNAYGVENNNKMQRFCSRLKLMYEMSNSLIFSTLKSKGVKIHFLGMVDGPNEVMFMEPFGKYIDSWDSSAAIWAGLHGIKFDRSPTGLINGKFEQEVDFDFVCTNPTLIELAKQNIEYIDRLAYAYIWK